MFLGESNGGRREVVVGDVVFDWLCCDMVENDIGQGGAVRLEGF